MGQYTILLVEDDEDILDALDRILTRLGHEVVTATSVEAAQACLSDSVVDLVFCDCDLRGQLAGQDLLESVQQSFADVPVVMMSSRMSPEQVNHLLSLGASDCVRKPFFSDACRQIIGRLLQSKAA